MTVKKIYPPLIEGLLNHLNDPIPSGSLPPEIHETHISWVLLAGDIAYKIKKPVNFGFVDFSSLALRKQACEEEIRINQRYSPEIYIEVATITGTASEPVIGGKGPILEFAVKMRRFPTDQTFDRMAATGKLLPEHLQGLASVVARFHLQSPAVRGALARTRLERANDFVEANFDTITAHIHHVGKSEAVLMLHAWTVRERAKLTDLLHERSSQGFIRECHGDLHLGNIVLLNGRACLFDGIEFNEDLRWIDTLSEIAFTLMDLEEHGLQHLGYLLLNRYLEITGDYAGLPLLDYYRLYRAMVRAKVAIIQSTQEIPAKQRRIQQDIGDRYIRYGLRLAERKTPSLIIMHGLSGSGKSFLASQLAGALPAIVIRSDIERKRLFAEQGSTGMGDLYNRSTSQLTYQRLFEFSRRILGSGHSVILDATFLRIDDRVKARKLAEECNSGFLILECEAPVELLISRIGAREAEGNDPSDADAAVLQLQMNSLEPPSVSEKALTLKLDMHTTQNIQALAKQVRQDLKKRSAPANAETQQDFPEE